MTDKSFPSAVYQLRNSVRNNEQRWENTLNNKSCSINICALLKTRDMDSCKTHTCVFITVL